MENVLKGLLLAVGVLVVAGIIGMAFTLNNKSSTAFNQGNAQLDSALQGFNDMDKQMYNGSTRSGTEVIQCIQKYVEADGIYVLVFTKAGGATVYDWSLTKKAADADVADVNAYTAINTEAARCSGFPAKDAQGQMINIVPSVAAGTEPTCTAFCSNYQSNIVAKGLQSTVTDTSTCNVKISAATQTTENGAYDATINTQDLGFISPNASFVSSVQVNQNNEVKFITFVQK